MKFVARQPREGINVSDTHPLVEASTLIVGLSAIFVIIALALIFMIEVALYFVSAEDEAALFDGWLPEDLVTVVPIIGAIGVEGYALLCLGFIGLLYVTGMLNRLAQMLHVPPAVFAVAAGVFVLIAIMGVGP